jgi:endonuclease/exonuclease/phosphatase family metal-dependent hydrolase
MIATPPNRKSFLRPNRWWAAAWVVGGVVGAAAWWGSDRTPAVGNDVLTVRGNAEHDELPGPRLRVGGFNIHGGKGHDRERDLGRTAETIRRADLDIVGLNEVHAFAWGSVESQAEDLGGRLGMASLFAPAERRYWHDDFGNALLSSVKPTSVQRIPLPGTQGYKYRNAVLSHHRVGGRTLHFVTTHIDRVKDRERQLRDVIALFLSLDEPCVLVGDFNTTADDPQLRALLDRPGVHDAVAEGLTRDVPGRIDWVITRGLKTVAAGCEEDGSSDHPIVWAEVELP